MTCSVSGVSEARKWSADERNGEKSDSSNSSSDVESLEVSLKVGHMSAQRYGGQARSQLRASVPTKTASLKQQASAPPPPPEASRTRSSSPPAISAK
jgi:hypothetical protein